MFPLNPTLYPCRIERARRQIDDVNGSPYPRGNDFLVVVVVAAQMETTFYLILLLDERALLLK